MTSQPPLSEALAALLDPQGDPMDFAALDAQARQIVLNALRFLLPRVNDLAAALQLLSESTGGIHIMSEYTGDKVFFYNLVSRTSIESYLASYRQTEEIQIISVQPVSVPSTKSPIVNEDKDSDLKFDFFSSLPSELHVLILGCVKEQVLQMSNNT